LVLPRVDRQNRRLILHAVEDLHTDLHLARMNIPEPVPDRPIVEPQPIDWVLVPGVAFDRQGHRLGRGGGYYDRLLPQLRKAAPRWALSFSEQLYESIPTEPHDVPLHGIFCPGGVILASCEFLEYPGS
jgi:5-formyltetrahydrofolate cyclo-ligase